MQGGSRRLEIKIARLFARLFCAEEEGFEPPVPRGTTVFKTAAFDHSATPLVASDALIKLAKSMDFYKSLIY